VPTSCQHASSSSADEPTSELCWSVSACQDSEDPQVSEAAAGESAICSITGFTLIKILLAKSVTKGRNRTSRLQPYQARDGICLTWTFTSKSAMKLYDRASL
jgi:hypothetical protein